MIWQVKETACWPAKWKCYPTRKYQEDNSVLYYHKTKEAAEKQANELNAKLCPICDGPDEYLLGTCEKHEKLPGGG